MHTKIIWKNEVEALANMAAQHLSMEEIGDHYGVTKQRIYQVFQKFGIHTPFRKRKSTLGLRGPKAYWLNHALTRKVADKDLRARLLETLELPDECPMLGIPLNYEGGERAGDGWGRTDSSPSLDQIRPSEGYAEGNVQIISWRANRIKNDSTPEELMRIAEYMKKLV